MILVDTKNEIITIIELIIKLMPYVLPKVNSISHKTNEPLDWN